MKRFEGRCALVTGAGSGIGEAVAHRLAMEGAMVWAADRDEALAARVAEAIGRLGGRARALALDVTDEEAMDAALARMRDLHPALHVLVNNAGIHHGGGFEETQRAHWRRLMAVNVEGAMLLSLRALPLLRAAAGGAIVNVSSISGLGGDFGQAAYATSKGALTHLTRSMALDLAVHGLRVNAVCPGSVRTPMFVSAVSKLDAAQVDAVFARTYPMGRIAEPHEVAAAVAFLASDDASFITGVNLPVDGGLTAHNGAPRFDAGPRVAADPRS